MLLATCMGGGFWGRMDPCICLAESLCCTPETITTFLVSYTQYKIKSFKRSLKNFCCAEDETPILWPPDAKNWLMWKDLDVGKGWKQEKGMTEDETVGWHHRFDGHESEQALGIGDGQGSLACCSPWGCKESDMTERLNWTYIGNSQVKLDFLFYSSLNIILFVYLCCHAGFSLDGESKATL